MKNLFKRLVLYIVALTSVWIIALGLIVGSILFYLKALLVALTPLIGPAWSYTIASLTCLALVFCLGLAVWSFMRPKTSARAQPTAEGESASEAARIVLQKYPLEAVAVAFALGLATTDSRELKKTFLYVMREFQ